MNGAGLAKKVAEQFSFCHADFFECDLQMGLGGS